MLLTFSKDKFVQLIKDGVKIHTIRRDENRRWRAGMKIHFWRGNPRNVKSGPYPFGEVRCTGVQEVVIKKPCDLSMTIFINGRELSREEIRELSESDGLTPRGLRDWFLPDGVNKFTGRIIHWTEKRY